MRVGIIADDLTGLNAVASEFQRYGLSVATCLDPRELSRRADWTCDVLGIDTDSRSKGEAEAAAAMREAVRAMNALEPEWLFKQTDSALHGHVGCELAAVVETLAIPRIVFAPACPSLGRRTRQGRQILEEEREIEIAPLIHEADRLRVIVRDAASDGDLDAIVDDAESSGEKVLAGSVGLAKALARHIGGRQMDSRRRPALILLGSLQPRTRAQYDALLRSLHPVSFELPGADSLPDFDAMAQDVVAALRAGRHAILAPAGEPVTRPGAGTGYPYLTAELRQCNEQAMRALVGRAIEQCRDGICGVLVAGGTTSEIVAREVLAVTRLMDVEHLSDGVAAAIAVTASGMRLPMVTKAGNWGDEDIMIRAVGWLQAAALRRADRMESVTHV